MSSAQTLDDNDRRTVARWAAASAEHDLPLFTAEVPNDERIPEAIARTRVYALGESTAAEEIRQGMIAVKAASAATSAAGAAAARAAAQASAVGASSAMSSGRSRRMSAVPDGGERAHLRLLTCFGQPAWET